MQQVQAAVEQIRNETEAKVQALQQKAAKAQGESKAAIEARRDEIEKKYQQWLDEAKSMMA